MPMPPMPTRLQGQDLDAVLAGIGWPGTEWGLPSGEANPNLLPYMARGLYPNPGHYHHVNRSNPVISSSIDKIKRTAASLPWRLLPPEEASAAEEEATQWAWKMFQRLPFGGFQGFLERALGAVVYGFTLFEYAWEVLPDLNVTWQDLRFVPPWTVHRWVTDLETGQLLGILQTSEKGLQFIAIERLAFFWGREFYGTNYEACSYIRPAYAWDRAFGDRLVADGVAYERYGAGTIIANPPDELDREQHAEEFDDVEAMLAQWENGERSWLVPPPGWDVAFNFGTAAIPDPKSRLEFYAWAMRAALGDATQDMARAPHGSYAAASTLNAQELRLLGGYYGLLAAAITQGPVMALWDRNGWDPMEVRPPRVSVHRPVTSDELKTMGDLATAGLFGDITPDDVKTFRELAGLGEDNP